MKQVMDTKQDPVDTPLSEKTPETLKTSLLEMPKLTMIYLH